MMTNWNTNNHKTHTKIIIFVNQAIEIKKREREREKKRITDTLFHLNILFDCQYCFSCINFVKK